MADLTKLQATDLAFYKNDIAFGCAQSANLSVSREMLEAVCAASGNFREVTPGRISWEGSVDALWRIAATADEATNVTAKDIFTDMMAGASFEVRFGIKDDSTIPQGYQLVGTAYWNSFEPAYSVDDNQSFSASFTGTGPLTLVANA